VSKVGAEVGPSEGATDTNGVEAGAVDSEGVDVSRSSPELGLCAAEHAVIAKAIARAIEPNALPRAFERAILIPNRVPSSDVRRRETPLRVAS
jgi:hypothetical protein